MGKTPRNGYLSNLGNRNVAEEKNEITVFKGFVIP